MSPVTGVGRVTYGRSRPLTERPGRYARGSARARGGPTVVVTGYDERSGCGYVLRTGPDLSGDPGARTVEHRGLRVAATAELAAMLVDALDRHPLVQLGWAGPEVPLTLDDPTMLAWLENSVGGVLTVSGGPVIG